jgi:hypothetical protein
LHRKKIAKVVFASHSGSGSRRILAAKANAASRSISISIRIRAPSSSLFIGRNTRSTQLTAVTSAALFLDIPHLHAPATMPARDM